MADKGLKPGSWWHDQPQISSIVNLEQLSTKSSMKVVRTGCGQRTGHPLSHFHFFLFFGQGYCRSSRNYKGSFCFDRLTMRGPMSENGAELIFISLISSCLVCIWSWESFPSLSSRPCRGQTLSNIGIVIVLISASINFVTLTVLSVNIPGKHWWLVNIHRYG